jgi:poly-beta-1,6-N-acetyl-D-glucosamine synthase
MALFYIFAGYPALLWVFARRREHTCVAPPTEWPMVSILVPVFNEASVIQRKIDNCLALDYPKDRLEIVIVSDGSTDQSVAIVKQCKDARVKVLEYPTNRGKAVVLNEAVPLLSGDVLVLTDASGIISGQSLRAVVPHFEDPKIGAVCGVYHILKQDRTYADSTESSYHGFEMKLRIWEGNLRTTLSGTGSLLAMRRVDYTPLPGDIINDDYVLPARLAIQGKRVIYEPNAMLTDRISTNVPGLFRRRVRIAYGNWQQIGYLTALLNPRRLYLSWVFLSHKLLRMLLPFIMLTILVSSFGVSSWVGWAFVVASSAGVLLGGGALLADRWITGHNPLAFIPLVLVNNVAVLVGTYKYFRGSRVKW